MTKPQTVRLTADDGHTFDAYDVHPEGAKAAIVVVQEIFGVNSHIRSLVDRFASFGYHAVAPAVFDRAKPGIELDYTSEGIAEGRGYVGEIGFEAVMRDVAAAVEHAAATGPVGIVGYCFGGTVAYIAAAELPVTAAVGYYGSMIPTMLDRQPKVPTMLHFGELDQSVPLEQIDKVRAAHPDVEVHVYEGADHGFSCDARGSYHAFSSAIALGRTLDFFGSNGVRP